MTDHDGDSEITNLFSLSEVLVWDGRCCVGGRQRINELEATIERLKSEMVKEVKDREAA